MLPSQELPDPSTERVVFPRKLRVPDRDGPVPAL